MSDTLRYGEFNCTVRFHRYAQDGAPAIVLVDEVTGERVSVASVWIPGLEPREVAVKDYSENTGITAVLIEAGLIEPTPLRTERHSHVRIAVHRLTERAWELARSVPT